MSESETARALEALARIRERSERSMAEWRLRKGLPTPRIVPSQHPMRTRMQARALQPSVMQRPCPPNKVYNALTKRCRNQPCDRARQVYDKQLRSCRARIRPYRPRTKRLPLPLPLPSPSRMAL
jgi:hypothetical protein